KGSYHFLFLFYIANRFGHLWRSSRVSCLRGKRRFTWQFALPNHPCPFCRQSSLLFSRLRGETSLLTCIILWEGRFERRNGCQIFYVLPNERQAASYTLHTS